MLLLEFYRRRRGLSQNELARRTGVAQTIISEHECGVREPDSQLRSLAVFLGVAADCAHRLLEPVPESLDPLAVRERVEREFAGQQERPHRRRHAAAKAHTGVPEPPSLSDAIRRSRQ